MGGFVGNLTGGGSSPDSIKGTAGNPVSGATGPVNKLMSPFGLGGEQGSYYSPEDWRAMGYSDPRGSATFEQLTADAKKGPSDLKGLGGVLSGYGDGSMSYGDAMAGLGKQGYTPDEMRQATNQMATNPFTGSKMATQQVQDNAILGQMFGQGGQLSKATQQADELNNRGFSLKPEDYEAYGQGSGNIARMFGGREQGIASSLANRGFGGANSGMAGAQFSGLQGNKDEQLANLQTGISQQRMQMNQQRLNDVRSYATNLSQQAAGNIQNQYARNMSGVENNQKDAQAQLDDKRRVQNALLGVEQNYSNMVNSGNTQRWAANEQARQASAANQQGREGQTLFGAIGHGLYADMSGGGVNAMGAYMGGGSSGGGKQQSKGEELGSGSGSSGNSGGGGGGVSKGGMALMA